MAKIKEVEKAIRENIPLNIARENLKLEQDKRTKEQDINNSYLDSLKNLGIEVLKC